MPAPTIRVIPYTEDYRIEWDNAGVYTKVEADVQYSSFRAGFGSPVQKWFADRETVDITSLVDLTSATAFNSLTTAQIRALPPGQRAERFFQAWATRSTVWIRLYATEGGNRLESNQEYRLGRIFREPDPGATTDALPVPSPLSDVHKITLFDLEKAYLSMIPPGLACDYDSNLGRMVRLIAADDYDKVVTTQKMFEEQYSTTTDLAVEELEAEYFDPALGCYQPSSILNIRRRAILAARRGRGGNTREYVENLAYDLGFRGVEVTETFATKVGFRAGDRLRQTSVWITWARTVDSFAPSLTALECFLSEGRQSGVRYYLAQQRKTFPNFTYKQIQ